MKRTGFTLIELMIVIAIIGILVAIVVGVVGKPSRAERCKELCDGLRHRMVKVTRDVCICENPETKERQAYPMQNGSYGASSRGSLKPRLLERED